MVNIGSRFDTMEVGMPHSFKIWEIVDGVNNVRGDNNEHIWEIDQLPLVEKVESTQWKQELPPMNGPN